MAQSGGPRYGGTGRPQILFKGMRIIYLKKVFLEGIISTRPPKLGKTQGIKGQEAMKTIDNKGVWIVISVVLAAMTGLAAAGNHVFAGSADTATATFFVA